LTNNCIKRSLTSILMGIFLVTAVFLPITSCYAAYGDRLLYHGTVGDDVRELQRDLTGLGFSTYGVDGIFGPKTLNAVLSFQKANGLAADGIAGPNTKTKLTELVGGKGFTYTVASGDSLWFLANRYGSTVAAIKQANGLTSDMIYVGQKLTIPGKGAEGNQRVLKARLDDAYFFYREDTKEPLESKVELLKNVIYQARLGTIWEKTERLQKLSAFIARELGFEQIELTERAALLCKADLETSMVYEFPELQGIMGQNYALIDGEDPMVAQAIFEHYLPRFAGDDLPVSPAGTALSLAEKFDNLVGNFAIGVRPTGSQDPYALRRQALGIVAIVLGSNLKLDLHKVISTSYRQFAVSLDLTEEETINAVMDFILLRLRGVLQDEGVSYDVLDAVMNLDTSQLLVISERARALAEIKEQPYFSDLMVAFSRPFNLSRKGGDCKVQPGLFEDQAERELFEVTARLTRELESYLTQGNYFCYCEELAAMRPSLDAFFARIMVMVEDEQIRENRLALLKQVAQLFLAFADFSKLVV
jgi:glycyl-tRNA synthetase beta chain